MRHALNAVTEELRRLKTAGVSTVTVSDGAMVALRRVVTARKVGGEKPAAILPPVAPPPSAAPLRSAAPPPAPARAAVPVVPILPAVVVAALPPPPVVVLPPGEKKVRWEALNAQVIADPACCANLRPGKKVVLGVGSLEAKIMFVGEAPGAEEEIQGEPFVGPAGQLLTKMIQGMGLARGEVYIGNIMNWRPEMPLDARGVQFGNRPPTEAEMAYCLPYLRAQIEVVSPDLIVALGATATQGLLGPGAFKALGEVRGTWKEFAGRPLMVTYHPSYILRNQSNRSKRLIWEDLLKVLERAGHPITDKQRGFFLDRA